MLSSLQSVLNRLFAPPAPQSAAPLAGIVAAEPAAECAAVAAKVEQVQNLIGQVSELTSTVASDVGQHNVNVQAISSELATAAKSDPTTVSAIVCKLVLANQELQSRLERAENTLQAHSRQLHDAISSARTDGLTGLMNRRALDEELKRCLVELQGQGRPAALLMLDVDHFKRFNDTFGHVAGDQALIHVSETLRTQSRATDLVARFGGEEFAVVFTAATAEMVRERAERLRMAIGRRTVGCDGKEVQVTASAGLAEAATDDVALDWIKRADAALYAAKHAGRNCAFLSANDQLEPLTNNVKEEMQDGLSAPAPGRCVTEAAAELAAEAFADTTFVQTIAKRIAEWRRGGGTLTIVLAKFEQAFEDSSSEEEPSPKRIRAALQCARSSTREMDLLTRWGNDGLAVLLPSTSAADAKVVARRIRNSLTKEAGKGEEGAHSLSMSIGMAEGIEGNDANRVLERAWLALDVAQSTGGASIFVHDGIKAVAVKTAVAVR
jgi:diguanylate cyclase